MEFPDLGAHCSWPACQRLDFLPLKCDACEQIFCTDHIAYAQHSCTSAYKKDVQVPVCPLCNTPIPVRRGEMPDVVVGEHIDRDCKSDPAQRKRKIFTNKCMKAGCKQKEMMKVICDQCHKNYCLKHRHPLDHDCSGAGRPLSKAGCEGPSILLQNSHHIEQWSCPASRRLLFPSLCQRRQSSCIAASQHLPSGCHAAERAERGRGTAASSGDVPGRVSTQLGATTQHAGGGGSGTGPGTVSERSRVPAIAAADARFKAIKLQHVIGRVCLWTWEPACDLRSSFGLPGGGRGVLAWT